MIKLKEKIKAYYEEDPLTFGFICGFLVVGLPVWIVLILIGSGLI
jgi:hypothetical protein